MPKLAFAPLFVAWLGFGISPKVALAAFISVFPIVVGTAAGLHAADDNARMLFKSIGSSRLQTLLKLEAVTGSGLPQFFTGLKIAAISVVSGAIAGEFLGGGRSFGELIRVAAAQLDTPRVFSLIIYLSLLGLLMFGTVSWMQYKFVFWHRTSSNVSSRARGIIRHRERRMSKTTDKTTLATTVYQKLRSRSFAARSGRARSSVSKASRQSTMSAAMPCVRPCRVCPPSVLSNGMSSEASLCPRLQ